MVCGGRNPATGTLREGTALKVRTACKPFELQVDAAMIGLQAFGAVTVRTGNTLSTNGGLSTPALCNPGEVATGGGAISSVSGGAEIIVRSSRPQPETEGSTPTGWRISAANLNPGVGQITVTAYAVCASP